MRTYENLVKRMNMVKKMLNALPERLYFDDLATAYKGETYLRKSFEVLMEAGIRTNFLNEEK